MEGNETKLVVGVIAGTVVLILGGAMLFGDRGDTPGILDPDTRAVSEEILLPEDRPFRGPEDAPVTIVEFADFQCPACAAMHPVLDRVLEEYEGEVRHVFRHFPLEQIHDYAFSAATAAEASRRQGLFWEMHRILFDEQPIWAQDGDELFLSYAEEIDIDFERFREDMEDPEIAGRIREDIHHGRQAGVRATPTLFINGRQYHGGINYDNFLEAIEEAAGLLDSEQDSEQ